MSNGMAQEAAVLEREVTNYWLAHYFRAQSQSNPERSWRAMLLMWMRTVSTLTSSCHCPPLPVVALVLRMMTLLRFWHRLLHIGGDAGTVWRSLIATV